MLEGVGLIGEDLFAAGCRDHVAAAAEFGDVAGFGPEKDPAIAGPEKLKGEVVLEDGRGIGEEGAVPEVGGAAVEDVEIGGGGVGLTWPVEIEAQGAGGLVFAVDDDDVGKAGAGCFELRLDSGGELLGRKDRGEDAQARVGGEKKEEGADGEADGPAVRVEVAAKAPAEEGAPEEHDGGKDEGYAEGSHGAGG